MKVQCDVEAGVWRLARVYALEDGRTLGAVVTCALQHYLQDRCGPKVPATASKRVAVASDRLENPHPTVPTGKAAERAPVEDLVSTGKCSQCGDTFALGKLTKLPVAGGRVKSFCRGCIDNIKNGQA